MSERDWYWARADREELGQELRERVGAYYQHVQETGRLRRWRESIATFRGFDPDGALGSSSEIGFGGETGEQVRFRVNHYGAITQGIHTLITGAPPTTRSIAQTSDRAGVDQAAVADKLLDYDRKESGLTRLLDRAALYALHSGEGWIYQAWNAWKGRPIGTQPIDAEGMPIPDQPFPGELEEEGEELPEAVGERILYEGDVEAEALHPIDVWRDPDTQLDAGRPYTWIGCRRRVSRWDLLARYPEFRDEILSVSPWDRGTDGAGERELFETMFASGAARGLSDRVYLYEWYHPPSPSLPLGRYAWMVGETVLEEGPYPYDAGELPLIEMMPDIQEDSCFGFTPLWHLLAPQAAYDSTVSAAITNLEMFGVQNVYGGDVGDEVQVDKLESGMNVIYARQKPEALQLTEISEDSFKFLDLLQRTMELLSGANRTMRGDPEANLKSGAALALVQALAVQHNSGHHRSYASMVERTFTGRVRLWQRFVSVPRMAEIVGDDERVSAQEWTADSISGVSRVAVEMTNPVFATSEGKKQLAEYMAAMGWANRHEFMQVVATGRLDPLLKRDQAEQRLIMRENERLREGAPVKAVWTDRHRMHMREHSVELSDPNVRFDDEAVARIAAHIDEHRNLLFGTPPELLEAIGEPPPAVAPPMEGAGGEPMPGDGPPMPGGGPPEAAGGPSPMPSEPGPLPELAAAENLPGAVANPMGGGPAGLPQMPQMPAPGERVNPVDPQF